jgi:hypothetical protein
LLVSLGDNARVQGETKCGMDTSSLLKVQTHTGRDMH